MHYYMILSNYFYSTTVLSAEAEEYVDYTSAEG